MLVKSPYSIEFTMDLVNHEEILGNISDEDYKAFMLSEENVIPKSVLEKINKAKIKRTLGYE